MSWNDTKRHGREWFALIDAELCRLFCCHVTEHGRYHINEHDSFVNTLPEQRPPGRISSVRVTHFLESNELRFASEVVRRLQKKATQNKFDRMVIYVAPRLHGVLQMVSKGTLNVRIEELNEDFERIQTGWLESHPKVRELMQTSDGT